MQLLQLVVRIGQTLVEAFGEAAEAAPGQGTTFHDQSPPYCLADLSASMSASRTRILAWTIPETAVMSPPWISLTSLQPLSTGLAAGVCWTDILSW